MAFIGAMCCTDFIVGGVNYHLLCQRTPDMPFRQGLVVGKFAPLHRGHEALLDFASAQCDALLILSYTSQNFAQCNSQQRATWLRHAFPRARVLVLDDALLATWTEFSLRIPSDFAADDVQREFVRQVLGYLAIDVDAVFTSEAYGEGFAAYLSRCGQRVQHVSFDPARRLLPISATQIRQNPQANRQWLSHCVYDDFHARDVERIALLGGESSGKSTLAVALAGVLKTSYAAEFGRELWEAQQGQLAFSDLLMIAQTQVAREQQLQSTALGYLVCDTTPLTTLFYSQAMFGRVEPQLAALAQRHYQHVFLLAPDFPFVQDGTRQGDAFRQQQHQWYLAQLAERHIAYTILTGSLRQRVQQVCEVLQHTAVSDLSYV